MTGRFNHVNHALITSPCVLGHYGARILTIIMLAGFCLLCDAGKGLNLRYEEEMIIESALLCWLLIYYCPYSRSSCPYSRHARPYARIYGAYGSFPGGIVDGFWMWKGLSDATLRRRGKRGNKILACLGHSLPCFLNIPHAAANGKKMTPTTQNITAVGALVSWFFCLFVLGFWAFGRIVL